MENLVDMFTVMIFLGSAIALIWGIDWGWYSENPKRRTAGKVIFAFSLMICIYIVQLIVKSIDRGSVFRLYCK